MLGFLKSARSGKGRSLFAESKRKISGTLSFPTASTSLQFPLQQLQNCDP